MNQEFNEKTCKYEIQRS
ncbi:MAG: hypothetical protein EU535_06110 [Promethearchaeota archaeon]|nr:MAG: hypothetical protein EU535_06110 [Candidatus Lokiarchaeota archaeon]